MAHDGEAELIEELIVLGRAEQRIGEATSASEGIVGFDDIRLPPLLRVGELTEAVPGMVATQHSGTGKANQYFLRGFDADHGTDVAFFVDGELGAGWSLTASADTREAALDELFSNFLDKSPESLFRRIDPDYYYPTFGDDSTVEEMAPSMGKFYVRLANGDDFGHWGNFKVGYMNNELAHVDRGLYGANFHFETDSATEFGEKKFVADVFAAEPGTVGTREEFRGTGGSLYFLQRQDVLTGSERVRIEIRDKASGIVTGVVNLMPAMDYDIDYLQGRILLTEPLSATVDDNLLVRSDALSGDEAYLVVRYEYTPGFEEIDSLSVGGQGHAWIGDYVKLGLTTNTNEQDADESSLNAADITLRLSAHSWIKLQQATTEGLVSLPQVSQDGGFGFASYDPLSFVNAKADAQRCRQRHDHVRRQRQQGPPLLQFHRHRVGQPAAQGQAPRWTREAAAISSYCRKISVSKANSKAWLGRTAGAEVAREREPVGVVSPRGIM